ncbi:unnamed protein product [Aureobasidium uvarum]|uniref:Uncharacterized protein n=1 Tax=Aureobasidium uvarum TaxID=2773716 RepID=A0A9N8KL83_9PEZI|nr:unnamed protein product [Aureobasidium uvarum]
MPSQDDPPFDPVRCAHLHNELVQRAIKSQGAASTLENVLEGYDDDFKTRLLPDLESFLANIIARPMSNEPTLLTPFCHQPNPKLFFQNKDLPHFAPFKDTLVLLYPGEATGSGLLFSQQHNVAAWISSDLQLPAKKSWLPLFKILERWIQMWDTGKITPELNLVPWTERDLQASLVAWNELVDVIEAKLPKPVTRPITHEPLIEQSVAQKWTEQSFQYAFLIQARRPAFSGIAPGVSVLSTGSFEALHAGEPEDSERKQVIGRKPGDPEDYQSALSCDLAPTLLCPGRAVESSWRDHSKPSLRDYRGRGSALLKRKAGLYLCPDESWSDAVVFSDGRGRESLFTYRGSCPWMPGRPPALLRDVLRFWKKLVVDEIWKVGDSGVFGNMAHFHSLPRGLVSVTGNESYDEYCADWDVATSF